MKKIGAVVVTYNRKEKLERALQCFEEQTICFSYVLVVNNASTDGTKQFLKDWKEKKSMKFEKMVVDLNDNTGGSGGFFEGLKIAKSLDADFIWVSDDDAFPESNAIEKAMNFINKNKNRNISAICGTVVNKGSIDLVHRRKVIKSIFKIKEKECEIGSYDLKYFTLDEFSFVGALINKDKIEEVGLPIKEYFIWYDDTEYSIRLSRVGEIICIPTIRIHHDTDNGSSNNDWKFYYGLRNRLDMMKRHYPKRYFLTEILKYKIKLIKRKMFNRKPIESNIMEAAIDDVIDGKLGLHKIFKPGWKFNE